MKLEENAPRAGRGDYDGGKYSVSSISKTYLEKKYRHIVDLRVGTKELSMHLLDMPGSIRMVVGFFDKKHGQELYKDEERFIEIACLDMDRTNFSFDDHYEEPIVAVTGVFTDEKYRGNGIGSRLYTETIKLGYLVMCDDLQYYGARKIWSRLSESQDYAVDVVNIEENKVVATEVELNQGTADEDFTEEFWSYYHDKTDLLFVLRRK
jgi:GNAT superfamily N-acetyltransferase